MKTRPSLILLLLFPICASTWAMATPAQDRAVSILQQKWSMEVRNPALDKDPVASVKEREDEARRRQDAERQNEIKRQQGMPTVTTTVDVPAPDPPTRGTTVTYIYELKIKNTGTKEIRTLTWEYVFSEPGTERELGRRRFVGKVSIGPGKTRNLVMRSASSPTGTIEAKAGRKSRDEYSEQVVIQRIEYADGSMWQAASN